MSDDNLMSIACTMANMTSTVVTGRSRGLSKWIIMSKPNTVHPTHEDANGLCTICMLDGFKWWLFGLHDQPRQPLPAPAPGPCERDWHFTKFKGYCAVPVVLCSVGGSDHLCVFIIWFLLLCYAIAEAAFTCTSLLPPGISHCVACVELPACPMSALMWGEH